MAEIPRAAEISENLLMMGQLSPHVQKGKKVRKSP